jgi:hypothetical protein
METDLNNIHVFKTDIRQADTTLEVHRALDEHQEIIQWSIDCEDVDCVLRIVSETLDPRTIMSIVHQFGHDCQELT